MILYRLRTTFMGADSPSEFYFDTLSQAELNLEHLPNGDITKVNVIADYELNYSDGCTLNDLTYGNFDAEVKEV